MQVFCWTVIFSLNSLGEIDQLKNGFLASLEDPAQLEDFKLFFSHLNSHWEELVLSREQFLTIGEGINLEEDFVSSFFARFGLTNYNLTINNLFEYAQKSSG